MKNFNKTQSFKEATETADKRVWLKMYDRRRGLKRDIWLS